MHQIVGDLCQEESQTWTLLDPVQALIGGCKVSEVGDLFDFMKSGPEQQPNYERYTRHEHVVTGDSDASTCDGNHVVREQSFLPGVTVGLFVPWGFWFHLSRGNFPSRHSLNLLNV